jgi:hypothetical protein
MNKNLYILNGEPIVKTKSFCPNPVVVYGIPDYANSVLDKRVVGTESWKEWWYEQVRRCVQGYWTGGLYIPGRYYYFLNFSYISTPGKGFHQPMFIDYQYEFFLLIEHVKKERKGIISLKARRKGLSEQVVNGVFDYGMRFKNSYHAGIVAGQQIHADGFYMKYQTSEALLPPELHLNYLVESKEETVSGYNEKTDTGYIKKGSMNTILVRTMFSKDNVFKGEALDDCVFEEGGEFELLLAGYNSTQPCFMVGNEMVGTPFVYGTGGNMQKGSKGFAEMWTDPSAYQLEKFWVPATKMFFPAVSNYKNERGNLIEDIPNLKKEYPFPYQRVGMQDEVRAKELIETKRAELYKMANKKKYFDYLQNYPLSPKEAFLSFNTNDYNTDLLQERRLYLMSNPPLYRIMILEWEKDSAGNIAIPLKVKPRLAQTDPSKSNYDNPENYILVSDEPIEGYTNLDLGGLDGYNIDQSSTSKSTGSFTVYRQTPVDNSLEGSKPVCLYNARPKTKEIFFSNCLKISCWYNLISRTNIDVGSSMVIDYYKSNGGIKYLAKRPKSLEKEDSAQTHDYGTRFTIYNIEIMESMMQTEIENHINKWPFIHHVNDCLGYKSKDLDNDADNHDSFVLCLGLRQDLRRKPMNLNSETQEDPYSLPDMILDGQNNLVIKNKEIGDFNQEDYFRQLHNYGRDMEI